MTNQNEICDLLNSVLGNSMFNEKEYLALSKKIEHPTIKEMFLHKHREFFENNNKLKAYCSETSIILSENKYEQKVITKNWINAASKKIDNKLIIENLIELEGKSLSKFYILLERDDLPVRLRALLEKQKQKIEQTILKLKPL